MTVIHIVNPRSPDKYPVRIHAVRRTRDKGAVIFSVRNGKLLRFFGKHDANLVDLISNRAV